MPSTSRAEAAFVGTALALSAVLFLPAAADPVNVVKLVVVVAAAVACVSTALYRLARHREGVMPVGVFPTALAVLSVALVVAAVGSPSATTAVLGTPGRLAGLLLYTTCMLLGVSTLRAGSDHLWVVEVSLALAGGFTAAYGALQLLGLDAINWANDFNPLIAALGNPNFASAYLGICVPLFLSFSLRAVAPARWRWTAAAGAVALTLLAVLSSAAQGPLCAMTGSGVVVLAWLLDQHGTRRRAGLAALALATVGGSLTLALGVKGLGPAARLFGAGSFQTRRWYWNAAMDMWRKEPVLGVGIDHYGRNWRTSRPLDNVSALGGGDYTDAAHSVPLHLLATGGLVVAVAYALVVIATSWALLQGMRRLQGDARLRLAGVGGAWVAYQVQSLVSIDQVPLVVLNFVLAAAVVVASGTGKVKHVRLPGALPPPEPARPGRRQAVQLGTRTRDLTGVDLVALSVVGLLTVAALWFSLTPLRADLAIASGDEALRTGDGNASLEAYQHAADLLPGRSLPWSREASLLTNVRQPAAALTAYDRAIEADPSDISVLEAAARVAEEQQQLDRARRYHRQALAQDPYNPATVAAAATFELRHGGAAAALEILEAALQRTPAKGPLWTPLGDARQVTGDRSGAVQAYEQALLVTPTDAKATAELAKLRAAS